MNIFRDYTNIIKSAMEADTSITKGFSQFSGDPKHDFSIERYLNESRENKPFPSLQDFVTELGVKPNYDQQLGAHPNFSYLKNSGKMEKHYIVSTFIDIKGSTNLFKRYSPETVFIISNTVQKAAIHICLIFGGYVHRLQGDGVFVYFGGRETDKNTAVHQALKSSSMLNYFVKNELKDVFNQQGVETIYTRIGIDLGDDGEVVWAMAGTGNISEVTTCSLHTSLASKMQGSANSNGVVVGENVKLLADQDYFSVVSQRTGIENDRYIFRNQEESFNYTQYDFDWMKFLKRQSFIATDLQGNLVLKRTSPSKLNPSHIKPIAEKVKPYLNTYGY